ncbi:hypothetical protein LEP1GSC170_3299, partial [Leptospira interrogans serovar Bataviae str. HAI135]
MYQKIRILSFLNVLSFLLFSSLYWRKYKQKLIPLNFWPKHKLQLQILYSEIVG